MLAKSKRIIRKGHIHKTCVCKYQSVRTTTLMLERGLPASSVSPPAQPLPVQQQPNLAAAALGCQCPSISGTNQKLQSFASKVHTELPIVCMISTGLLESQRNSFPLGYQIIYHLTQTLQSMYQFKTYQ